MITAFFDTSTSEACFLVQDDQRTLLKINKECLKGASKLLPHIRQEIAAAGISINDIEQWYVGIGPGSFTGIRVGIAFVKGVCSASGAKYVGINSGLAYLSGLENCQQVTVLHDGRKSELICNSFVRQGNFWQEHEIEVKRIADLQLTDAGTYVTQMPLDVFSPSQQNDLLSCKQLEVSMFSHSASLLPQNHSECEISCVPIYVRPPVFVQPPISEPQSH